MDYNTMVHKFSEVFTQYITIIIDIDKFLITNNECDGDGDIPNYKTWLHIIDNMNCPIKVVTEKFIKIFLETITYNDYYETFKDLFETYFNEDDFHLIQKFLCRTELYYFTKTYGQYTDMLEYEKDFYIKELIIYSSEKFFEKHIDVINNIINNFITPTYYLK
jgi:hypothetical protein